MKGLREGILLCLKCERMMRSRWVGVRPRWSKKGERDAGVKRAERRDPKGKGEKGYSNLK